jgi:hypothetical protein
VLSHPGLFLDTVGDVDLLPSCSASPAVTDGAAMSALVDRSRTEALLVCPESASGG